MPQQLPQIPVLPTGHPDPRKAVFQHQLQNELRILAIGLLLAYALPPLHDVSAAARAALPYRCHQMRVSTTNSTWVLGADVVMESITQVSRRPTYLLRTCRCNDFQV